MNMIGGSYIDFSNTGVLVQHFEGRKDWNREKRDDSRAPGDDPGIPRGSREQAGDHYPGTSSRNRLFASFAKPQTGTTTLSTHTVPDEASHVQIRDGTAVG